MLALENSIPYKIHVFFPEKLSLEKSKHFGLLVLEKKKNKILKKSIFPNFNNPPHSLGINSQSPATSHYRYNEKEPNKKKKKRRRKQQHE